MDILVQDLKLQEARAVSSPGEPECKSEAEENDCPLGPEEATRYRAMAARANYLAADRTDLLYATKEVCRHMATLRLGH